MVEIATGIAQIWLKAEQMIHVLGGSRHYSGAELISRSIACGNVYPFRSRNRNRQVMVF